MIVGERLELPRPFPFLSGIALLFFVACQAPDLPDQLGPLLLSGMQGTPETASPVDSATGGRKKIFITASNPEGGLGGISGADSICSSDSDKPDDATYKALIVDGINRIACTSSGCQTGGTGENVDWVMTANTTYYRAADEAILGTTNDGAVFPSGGLDNPFSTVAGLSYWTGLGMSWLSNFDCNNWENNTNAFTGDKGDGDLTSNASITDPPASNCDLNLRLLCVQQ